MKNSYKKIEAILCLVAGVGLFLPLLTVSGYGQSASVSFMTGFDMTKLMEGGVFNSKVVLGVLIAAFIILIVRTMNRDSFGIKMVSFLLVIASLVLFYMNVDKLGSVKNLVSSMIKYGIGYYASLFSLIIAFVLGLLDLFTNNNSNSDIDEIERIIDSYHANNTNPQVSPVTNPTTPVNNVPMEPTVPSNPINQGNLVNSTGVSLNELVNRPTTPESTINNNPPETPVNQVNNNSNNVN